MAKAARDLDYAYLGVSDHSRSAHYAGGLSIDDILCQHDEVDALNEAAIAHTANGEGIGQNGKQLRGAAAAQPNTPAEPKPAAIIQERPANPLIAMEVLLPACICH